MAARTRKPRVIAGIVEAAPPPRRRAKKEAPPTFTAADMDQSFNQGYDRARKMQAQEDEEGLLRHIVLGIEATAQGGIPDQTILAAVIANGVGGYATVAYTLGDLRLLAKLARRYSPAFAR